MSSGLGVHKTLVGKLKVGDYVSALDRPWLDTPFLVQGFYIESEDDIIELTKYCEFVYVDEERNQTRTAFKPRDPVEREKNIREMFDRQKLEVYSDISGWNLPSFNSMSNWGCSRFARAGYSISTFSIWPPITMSDTVAGVTPMAWPGPTFPCSRE